MVIIAEFVWQPSVDAGCPLCGTSADERGFVDCIADTLVRNPYGEVTGVVNITLCAHCIEQISRMVGCTPRHETLELTEASLNLANDNEKLRDEVQAWSQRYQMLLDNLSTDISTYIKEKDANTGTKPRPAKPSANRS